MRLAAEDQKSDRSTKCVKRVKSKNPIVFNIG